jgi:hypothetical protein
MKKNFYTFGFLLLLTSVVLTASHVRAQNGSAGAFERSSFCQSVEVYSASSDAEPIGFQYSQYSSDLDSEKSSYHAYVNKRFDANLREIGNVVSENKDITPEQFRELLVSKKLATWFLARELVCSFEKYSKILTRYSYDVTLNQNENTAIADLLRTNADRLSVWRAEIETAKKALDTALATYDQIAVTFPLHLQFRKAIQDLSLYREQFALIRKVIGCFPSKFVNNSTTQCN